MSSAVNGILGGQPSRLTPTPPPWLSPQVLMRNSLPKLLPIPIVVVVVVIPTPKASVSLLHSVSVAASAKIEYFMAGACRAGMVTRRYGLRLQRPFWAGRSCTYKIGVFTLAAFIMFSARSHTAYFPFPVLPVPCLRSAWPAK